MNYALLLLRVSLQGGIQSNHCRATATCARCDLGGMQTTQDPPPCTPDVHQINLAPDVCPVNTSGSSVAQAHQTCAACCRYMGLDCHLVLRNAERLADDDPGLVGNLLVERLQGAYIHQAGAPATIVCVKPCCELLCLYNSNCNALALRRQCSKQFAMA